MDAIDSVRAKVQSIFTELVGARAEILKGDVAARGVNDILSNALASHHERLTADQIAFHLVDWNSDAAFIVAMLLFPERFTNDELAAGSDLMLCHVPAHVMAAARLAGHEVRDTFLDENAT